MEYSHQIAIDILRAAYQRAIRRREMYTSANAEWNEADGEAYSLSQSIEVLVDLCPETEDSNLFDQDFCIAHETARLDAVIASKRSPSLIPAQLDAMEGRR